MKSDQELKQAFQISVGGNSDLIIVTFLKDVGREDSVRLSELAEVAVLKILNQSPSKRFNVLLDILPVGKIKYVPPSQTRKIWARLASHKQMKKKVVVGSSLFFKVVVSFIARTIGEEKSTKWFADKERALAWLHKK